MANWPAALFVGTILTTFLKWKRFKVLYLYNPPSLVSSIQTSA
jgi:hypothetical protein